MESTTILDSSIPINDWYDKLLKSMSPSARRNLQRYQRTVKFEMAIRPIFFWMQWPILIVFYTFWDGIMREGFKSTLNPHWGRMAWMFLNDGMHPSLWHTLQCVFHPKSRTAGTVYPSGAPKNSSEAHDRD